MIVAEGETDAAEGPLTATQLTVTEPVLVL